MKRSNEYPTDQQSKLHRVETDDELNMSHVNENSNESSTSEVLETNMTRTNEHPTDQQSKSMQTANDLDMSRVNVRSNESSSSELPETMATPDNQKVEPTTTSLKGTYLNCGCSFSEALDNDFVFIDKSLFVESVLESGFRSVIITAPRRMGKSFNLNILKEFLSPCGPYGEARNPKQRLKGLRIMDQPHFDKVKKFMGKHPVVHLNLDRKSDLSNLDAVKSLFRRAVCESHREHLYILESDDPKLLALVNAGEETWMMGRDLSDSLKLLTKRLLKHHEQKCVFIVDGYDTMLTQLAKSIIRSRKEGDDERISQLNTLLAASQFILGALDTTIKGNDSVIAAVLVGISDIATADDSEPLNDVERFGFLRSSKFYAFFGFLENEYKEVVNRFKNKDRYLDEVQKLYNGYRYIDVHKKEIPIYNPWATFKFAATLASEPPSQAWCETGIIAATTDVCKIKSVRENILKLIQGEHITFAPVKKITYKELMILAEMCESPLSDVQADTDLYYTHLLNQGYLTANKIDELYITAEIPNNEIKKEFISFLRDHVKDDYGIQISLIPDCSKLILSLLNLLKKEEQEPIEYENKLNALYEKLIEVYTIDEEKTNLNEFVINCVSYFIGNELTKKKNCHADGLIYCRNGMKKGYLDVAYSYEKCVIIFENKLNDPVHAAIDQILERDYLSAYKEYKFILIGSTLDYSKSKSYKLGYLINSKEVDDLKILE